MRHWWPLGSRQYRSARFPRPRRSSVPGDGSWVVAVARANVIRIRTRRVEAAEDKEDNPHNAGDVAWAERSRRESAVALMCAAGRLAWCTNGIYWDQAAAGAFVGDTRPCSAIGGRPR